MFFLHHSNDASVLLSKEESGGITNGSPKLKMMTFHPMHFSRDWSIVSPKAFEDERNLSNRLVNIQLFCEAETSYTFVSSRLFASLPSFVALKSDGWVILIVVPGYLTCEVEPAISLLVCDKICDNGASILVCTIRFRIWSRRIFRSLFWSLFYWTFAFLLTLFFVLAFVFPL